VLIYDTWPQSRYASPTHITAELIKIMGSNILQTNRTTKPNTENEEYIGISRNPGDNI
jgi:hypothetical protein